MYVLGGKFDRGTLGSPAVTHTTGFFFTIADDRKDCIIILFFIFP